MDEEPVYNEITQNPNKPRARLTTVLRYYYQRQDKEPSQLGDAYDILLDGNAQLYEREGTAVDQWELVSTGWVKTPKLIVIRNMSKSNLYLSLMPESKEVVYPPDSTRAQQMLEPGECLPLHPFESSIFVRADQGEQADYLVQAVSR